MDIQKKKKVLRQARFGMLLLAALLGCSLSSYAEDMAAQDTQTTEDPSGESFNQEKFEKLLEKLDQNPELKKKIDQNGDGKVDPVEMKRAHQLRQEMRQGNDNDNNPPGLQGGPGTNWENRPGPQGGPGASQDYQGQGNNGNGYGPRRDFDNNPPGMRGGAGTNWENRPGPQGGPGASRDFQRGGNGNGPRRDFDNNPPGMRGGAGTNWENRPGPQGGPGAGPDRKK